MPANTTRPHSNLAASSPTVTSIATISLYCVHAYLHIACYVHRVPYHSTLGCRLPSQENPTFQGAVRTGRSPPNLVTSRSPSPRSGSPPSRKLRSGIQPRRYFSTQREKRIELFPTHESLLHCSQALHLSFTALAVPNIQITHRSLSLLLAPATRTSPLGIFLSLSMRPKATSVSSKLRLAPGK